MFHCKIEEFLYFSQVSSIKISKVKMTNLVKHICSQCKWFIINVSHSWLFHNLQITQSRGFPAIFEVHILILVFEPVWWETLQVLRVKSSSRAPILNGFLWNNTYGGGIPSQGTRDQKTLCWNCAEALPRPFLILPSLSQAVFACYKLQSVSRTAALAQGQLLAVKGWGFACWFEPQQELGKLMSNTWIISSAHPLPQKCL